MFKRTSKLVIDCTGVTSVLRANLPIKSFIEKRINRNNLEPPADISILLRSPNMIDLLRSRLLYYYLDQEIAPGGYAWVFPKGENKANIGLGVQQKALESLNKRNGKKKDLKSLIDEYILLIRS